MLQDHPDTGGRHVLRAERRDSSGGGGKILALVCFLIFVIVLLVLGLFLGQDTQVAGVRRAATRTISATPQQYFTSSAVPRTMSPVTPIPTVRQRPPQTSTPYAASWDVPGTEGIKAGSSHSEIWCKARPPPANKNSRLVSRYRVVDTERDMPQLEGSASPANQQASHHSTSLFVDFRRNGSVGARGGGTDGGDLRCGPNTALRLPWGLSSDVDALVTHPVDATSGTTVTGFSRYTATNAARFKNATRWFFPSSRDWTRGAQCVRNADGSSPKTAVLKHGQMREFRNVCFEPFKPMLGSENGFRKFYMKTDSISTRAFLAAYDDRASADNGTSHAFNSECFMDKTLLVLPVPFYGVVNFVHTLYRVLAVLQARVQFKLDIDDDSVVVAFVDFGHRADDDTLSLQNILRMNRYRLFKPLVGLNWFSMYGYTPTNNATIATMLQAAGHDGANHSLADALGRACFHRVFVGFPKFPMLSARTPANIVVSRVGRELMLKCLGMEDALRKERDEARWRHTWSRLRCQGYMALANGTTVEPKAGPVVVKFVSRRTRRLLNQQLLLDAVRAHYGSRLSVELVDFERMTVREQARVGADADILMGLNGSGLGWSWLMAPGGVVLEITYFNRAPKPTGINASSGSDFGGTAVMAGLHHVAYQVSQDEVLVSRGTQGGFESGRGYADAVISTDAFLELVRVSFCLVKASKRGIGRDSDCQIDTSKLTKLNETERQQFFAPSPP